MKHYVGETVDVYDGDFIGWTTAELTEFIGECGEYERWRMLSLVRECIVSTKPSLKIKNDN